MKLTNKKNTLILIGIILISILQLSMFIPFVQDKTTAIYCPKVFPLNDADKEWVENTLQKLTTKEKVAQMIMPWVMGNDRSADTLEMVRIKQLITEFKVGGFIYFQGDIINEKEDIIKMQLMSDIPLLISSDFENGLGMRLSDGNIFPNNMAVAATGDTSLAYNMGKAIAREARAIGVNQNYAPVADINDNPENPVIGIRSFSSDKNIVSNFTVAFIRGATAGGIISTVKHFPGHGNTFIDSHIDLPHISKSKTELYKNELYPFIKAINNGVQSIMIGHLNVPAIQKDTLLPSTLSPEIVTSLLKENLNFNGLIVTDAMRMLVITKYYSVAESALLAVKAGNDIILIPPDIEVVLNAVSNAVYANEISENRIDESVRKILSAKRWIKNTEPKWDLFQNSNIYTPHQKLAQKIADKSITLVKNSKKIIPVDSKKYRKVASIIFSYGIDKDSLLTFNKLISEEFGSVKSVVLNNNSRTKDFSSAYNYARNAQLIILPYFMRAQNDDRSQKLSKKYISFIRKIMRLKTPSILIDFGNPYIVSDLPQTSTFICAFNDVEVSQTAVVNAIMGKIPIRGRLPIDIPKTKYNLGFGLSLN